MRHSETDASFKRRKFTITEQLDEVLVDLAEQNYQGNVSLCLRAAIEDHRETLNGTNSGLVAQQLLQRVGELSSRQEQIITTVQSLENSLDEIPTEVSSSSSQPGQSDEKSRVLSELEATEAPLRIEDLTEQLDLPTRRILPTLETLIDQGMITPIDASPTRFQLAGRSRDNNEGVQ